MVAGLSVSKGVCPVLSHTHWPFPIPVSHFSRHIWAFFALIPSTLGMGLGRLLVAFSGRCFCIEAALSCWACSLSSGSHLYY